MNKYLLKSSKIFIVITIFAIIYYLLDKLIGNQFQHDDKTEKKINFWEAIYFSIITQSTIGYGDFSPAGIPLKIVVFLQALSTMVFVFGI